MSDDSDGDGVIDHVVVFAAGGIARVVLGLLVEVDAIEIQGRRIGLEPLWMGPRAAGGLFGPARTWQSLTPYITPNRRTRGGSKHRASEKTKARPAYSLTSQIVIEAKGRPGLGAASVTAVEPGTWVAERQVVASAFDSKRGRDQPPPDHEAGFVRLEFADPVDGPLALGFGAHFGLGLFVPDEP